MNGRTRKHYCVTLLVLLASAPVAGTGDDQSVCYGTTSNGRLKDGVQLPTHGANFASYGMLPELAGRTYVHSAVRDVIIAAYETLESEQPGKVFKFAETGFKEGGLFKPHKTHRNGLSVDFIVPVTDSTGKSVYLSTHPFNKYGYGIEFDDKDRFEEYTIDYEALAAHIVALHKAALQKSIGIWRVIFDPKLSPNLYTTKYGAYLKQYIPIPTKPSWVRHDDHYHVDFKVACEPMKG